ncbi:MAG TPA: M24 family metallopeptidase, partial [Candidatus Hydrogenedentes bacterium]|nr:M24 family metallopeptidase [Candidatus Hydrogenedentota bacterium]
GVDCAVFDGTALTVWQADTVGKAFEGELCSVADIVSRQRQVKDADEIARVRAAAELADEVIMEVAGGLREGMTEREAAARIEFAFKARGAAGASFDTIALFGARSSLPHGMPGDKRLEKGDIVLIDCGCRRDGYCSDLTRTFAFDTIPGAWFEEIYAVTLTAQEAALEALRPGMLCREADAIARNLIRDAGYGAHFGHGLGHGVGIEIHEAPRLNVESDTVIEEGMVVTVEPGIYLPGRGGVRIEDLVVITRDGCAILSRTPKQLKVLSG